MTQATITPNEALVRLIVIRQIIDQIGELGGPIADAAEKAGAAVDDLADVVEG